MKNPRNPSKFETQKSFSPFSANYESIIFWHHISALANPFANIKSFFKMTWKFPRSVNYISHQFTSLRCQFRYSVPRTIIVTMQIEKGTSRVRKLFCGFWINLKNLRCLFLSILSVFSAYDFVKICDIGMWSIGDEREKCWEPRK